MFVKKKKNETNETRPSIPIEITTSEDSHSKYNTMLVIYLYTESGLEKSQNSLHCNVIYKNIVIKFKYTSILYIINGCVY